MSKQSELVVISQDGIPPAAPPFNPRLTAPDAGTAVTTTYTVTVGSYGGANRYYLNTIVYPKLTLSRTYIYIFDLSDSTNTGHPLRFKDAAGSSYSTGVVVTGTPGAANAKVTLTVAANAPEALRYYCTVHGNGMGNTISVTNSASLDVGTNNYFDSGTLTANTSVNFSSVPTTAEWKYRFKTANLNGFDISKAVYSNNSGNIASTVSSAEAIFFKPDGTKMYVLDDTDDAIFEYSLSPAWDVSTIIHKSTKALSSIETVNRGLFFSSDGTRMYTSGNSYGGSVLQWELSVAWDITSAGLFNGASYLFVTGSQDSRPEGISLKSDGTKMYVLGSINDAVYEYNLSTTWEISTAVYSKTMSVSGQDTNPQNLFFKEDGTKLYVVGQVGDDINEYNLSTAYDISTASFLQLFSVSSQETAPTAVFIKPDGTHMYVVGHTDDRVFDYNLGVALTLTLPSSVVGTPSAVLISDRVTYTFITTNSGSTVNLIAEEII
mgnify:CR=1 FL=1